jgi:phosphate starvation-inducible protein PhoH and related proteins
LNAPATVREISLEGADNARLANFAGPMEQNLRHVEERLGVEVRRRGHQLQVAGSLPVVDHAAAVLRRMFALSASEEMTPDVVHLCVQEAGFPQAMDAGTPSGAGPARAQAGDGDEIVVHTQRGGIRGRGPHQREYLAHIRDHDLSFGIGPAGTGKTYLAVASAVEALHRGQVRRLVLVRPAVEAGERLGFHRVGRHIERQVIEVAPLAFMRGRSLNDSFVILDEAQNTTVEQMKMFLTRIGFGSKAVVTGDITQVDLPRNQRSGLRHVIDVLRGVHGVAFTFFDARDVVRHPLVQRIVQAYERAGDPDGPGEGGHR